MKILKLFIIFWIPTVIVLLLSTFSTGQTTNPVHNIIPTLTIIKRNIIVLFTIWSSGFLNKYIPYAIFGFNALFFSIILSINGNIMSIFEVMKYGIIEVLSFSIILSIAGEMNIKYLTSATILIIIAAFLENLIMRGTL